MVCYNGLCYVLLMFQLSEIVVLLDNFSPMMGFHFFYCLQS